MRRHLNGNEARRAFRYGPGLERCVTSAILRDWADDGLLVPAPAYGRMRLYTRKSVLATMAVWDEALGRIVEDARGRSKRAVERRERRERILSAMKAGPRRSAREVARVSQVPYSTFSLDLATLIQDGVVHKAGSFWVVSGPQRSGKKTAEALADYQARLAHVDPEIADILGL